MKKRLLYLVLPIITLILEILPYGAVCNFANPEGSPWRETYSYFNLTPFGYANVAPLITAIVTCIILMLTTVYIITGKKRIANTINVTTIIGAVISLGPLVFGINYFSLVGLLITVSLILEALLIHFTMKTVE